LAVPAMCRVVAHARQVVRQRRPLGRLRMPYWKELEALL
jgi:hypothetical protein